MAERPKRTLVAMVKPPKPISEMTDPELDEFVDALWRLVEQRLSQNERPSR